MCLVIDQQHTHSLRNGPDIIEGYKVLVKGDREYLTPYQGTPCHPGNILRAKSTHQRELVLGRVDVSGVHIYLSKLHALYDYNFFLAVKTRPLILKVTAKKEHLVASNSTAAAFTELTLPTNFDEATVHVDNQSE